MKKNHPTSILFNYYISPFHLYMYSSFHHSFSWASHGWEMEKKMQMKDRLYLIISPKTTTHCNYLILHAHREWLPLTTWQTKVPKTSVACIEVPKWQIQVVSKDKSIITLVECTYMVFKLPMNKGEGVGNYLPIHMNY